MQTLNIPAEAVTQYNLDDPSFLASEIVRQLQEKRSRGYHSTIGRCITVTSDYAQNFVVREVLPLLTGKVFVKKNEFYIDSWEFSPLPF